MHGHCSGLSSLSSASKTCSCTTIAVACRLCRGPAKPAHARPLQWLVVSVECQQNLLMHDHCSGLSSLSRASKACSCTAIAVACRLCRVPAKPPHARPLQWLVVSVECQQSLLMHGHCSGLSSLSSASKASSCTTIAVACRLCRLPAKPSKACSCTTIAVA